MKKATLFLILQIFTISLFAQINTDRVLAIGRNALYFEIMSFHSVLQSSYQIQTLVGGTLFYRAVAKINLDDFKGPRKTVLYVFSGTLF